MVATPVTAVATGVYCGIVLLLLGPYIDGPSSSSLWLIFGALAVGVPPRFFVLGVKRHEMVGLWLLERSLLIRVSAFLLAVATSAALGTMCVAILRSG